MSTPAEIRDAIATITQTAISDDVATVYPYPPAGLQSFPAIIVGRARWEPGENNWLHKWTVPVDVVVSQPGIDDQATVAQLEELWPDVLSALSVAIDRDPSLGGAVNVAWIARAIPGLVKIAGTQYPATSIEIEVHG